MKTFDQIHRIQSILKTRKHPSSFISLYPSGFPNERMKAVFRVAMDWGFIKELVGSAVYAKWRTHEL